MRVAKQDNCIDDLKKLAALIRQRNQAELDITRIVGRPAHVGHIGEFIGAKVFGIALASSASGKGYDGRFEEGPLEGRTVNIKWYAKREGLLDIEPRFLPDYYLVLTGPYEAAGPSRGSPRPWLITSVFLFDGPRLIDELTKVGIAVGIATSVRKHFWEAAELWPNHRNTLLSLTIEQQDVLRLFA